MKQAITTNLPRGWAIPGRPESIQPTEWFIDGIILRRGLAVIYGKGGHLKSSVALDMAMSVATGTAWQGKPTQQAVALYIAAERAELTEERSEVWRTAHGIADEIPCPIIRRQPNLRDERSVTALIDEILQVIGQTLPHFIVIDGLSMTWGPEAPGDMSNPTEIYRYAAALRRLQDAFDASILVIHHINKQGGMRDAEAIRDIVDTQIKAEYRQRAKRLTLSCGKQNAGEAFPKMVLPVGDGTAVQPDGAVLRGPTFGEGTNAPLFLPKPQRAILQALVNAGGSLAPKELYQKVPHSESTCRRHVHELVDGGLVQEEGETSAKRFIITDAGRAALQGKPLPKASASATAIMPEPRTASETEADSACPGTFPDEEAVAAVRGEIYAPQAEIILADILRLLRHQREARYALPGMAEDELGGVDFGVFAEVTEALRKLGFDILRGPGIGARWPS